MIKRLKRLPSSLREKRRYIAFRVWSDEAVAKDELIKGVLREVSSFLGERESARLNFRILDFDEASKQGFLVCSNRGVGRVKACLCLVNQLNGKRVRIDILGMSGTVRALKTKFLNKKIEVKEETKLAKFAGKDIKVVREYNSYADALTSDEKLLKRLRDLKLKFIGLAKADLKEEQHAANA